MCNNIPPVWDWTEAFWITYWLSRDLPSTMVDPASLTLQFDPPIRAYHGAFRRPPSPGKPAYNVEHGILNYD